MHLVVLQHGLWGRPADVEALEHYLRSVLPADTLVVNSSANEKNLTYDGIDVCGDRLALLVVSLTLKHAQSAQPTQRQCDGDAARPVAPAAAAADLSQDNGADLEAAAEPSGASPASGPITALSLIGYSLGGLMCRYAAGKLATTGYFEAHGVEARNFVTIATPHLGSFRAPESLLARTFNALVPLVTSRTGHQLMLSDSDHWRGRPLLEVMARPGSAFHSALRRFRRLAACANVEHDRTVPYCTAAIELTNPFEGHVQVPISPEYASIVRPGRPEEHQQADTSTGYYGRLRMAVLMALAPLFIPFLGYAIFKGVLHARGAAGRPRDDSWLDAHDKPLPPQSSANDATAVAAAGGAARPAAAPATASSTRADAQAVLESTAVAADATKQRPGGVPSSDGSASARRTSLEQALMLGTMREHEGIVEAPAAVHDLQAAMAGGLNELPWLKVPVQTRHFHSHAAIVIRDPRYDFPPVRAFFKYLSDVVLV